MHKSLKFNKKIVFWQVALLGFFLFFVQIQGVSAQASPLSTPEPSTPVLSGDSASGQKMMVVTAHPEATKAGYAVLHSGGSAVDAAIAAQLVLGLVEPQSSGLGGGGFALYYNAKTGEVSSFDGRETAPSSAGQFLFIGKDGQPMDFHAAAVGGRAVGVPGLARLMEMIHARHGVLPWTDLFIPAITLSERGFRVTPRLEAMVDFDYDRLSATTTATKLYFMPDAVNPIKQGDVLKNPSYARVLRALATQGAGAFYSGDIAENMVRTVRDYRPNPGLLSIEDLAAYQAIERQSICSTYRAFTICTMGEPSAGGMTLLSILGIVEHFNLAALGAQHPLSWHLIAEASRLAFVDRNYYLGDPHYVQSPGERLIDKDYLAQRAGLISQRTPMKTVSPGVPKGWEKFLPAPETDPLKPPGTTHISVVDGQGNMVAMTSSIEDAFGSRLMVDGFLLNNQLTDFSFRPVVDGKAVANRPEGGKRPRSSMAPTFVFKPDGRPFLVIGSAGGSAIPGYIAQRIIAMIDWQKTPKDALEMQNIINRGTRIEMEDDGDLARGLRAMGHPVEIKDLNSGLTMIHFDGGKMIGIADPRREGTAMGQ